MGTSDTGGTPAFFKLITTKCLQSAILAPRWLIFVTPIVRVNLPGWMSWWNIGIVYPPDPIIFDIIGPGLVPLFPHVIVHWSHLITWFDFLVVNSVKQLQGYGYNLDWRGGGTSENRFTPDKSSH